MKAVVYDRYGPPEVLHIGEVPTPVPKDHEILVRVRSAEVTKGDCEMRSFRFAVKWFWLPLRIFMGIRRPRKPILGGYFSGEIETVGAAVTRFKPGDAVFGCAGMRLGAYGEYLCLPDDYTIVPKPGKLSFAEAAAVPLGGLNALHFMRRARLQPGESVLINGAGGSIGTFAVQIAKSMGATVTVVDHTIKADLLRNLGADHFIDYTREDFTAGGQTYDVIFNMVARNNYARSIACLNPNGRYLTANPKLSDMIRSVLTSRFTDKTAIFAFAGETKEELLSLNTMIEAGEVRSVVDRIYARAQAAAAHHRVESEQRLGAIILAE
ncbi:MAG: NAD(P)-dependent alcohol dehydrogenase [Opitutaceae bacterium]|nr:NAD(P)-dependent alcohol dehydrogenase [Cephaloticoccus sp.]MCP5529227.1 NAD(P)-dependent alcohol dehydrogenase [Opitutaceae bacterium]